MPRLSITQPPIDGVKQLNLQEGLKLIDERIHGYCGASKRWVVLDSEAETDERWGKSPWERGVSELLAFGVINVDKPPGPTSHEVVSWVKRMLGVSRAGHGGTLEA